MLAASAALLPFTSKEFFEVFAAYNRAVWPAVLIAYLLGILTVAFVLKPGASRSRVVAVILAAMWVVRHRLPLALLQHDQPGRAAVRCGLHRSKHHLPGGGVGRSPVAGVPAHATRICRAGADRLRDPGLSDIGPGGGSSPDRASDVRRDTRPGHDLHLRLHPADDEAGHLADPDDFAFLVAHRRDCRTVARRLAGLDAARERRGRAAVSLVSGTAAGGDLRDIAGFQPLAVSFRFSRRSCASARCCA